MMFLNRLIGTASEAPRTRPEDRSPRRRRRAQFSLETLEGRDLKSDIPGVSAQWGMVYINATQASGNTATVSIDPGHNNDLRVTLNGNSAWFDASQIWTIGFNGSQGGSDTFVNDTNISDSFYGYGGNNQFYGGSGYNNVIVYGDYNAVDTRGGAGNVEAYNGPHDSIPAYSGVTVTSVNYNTSWFWW